MTHIKPIPAKTNSKKEQVEEMHLETQTNVIDLEEDKPRTKTIPTRELESKESWTSEN